MFSRTNDFYLLPADDHCAEGMLPRDKQRRTTHFNYLQEKQMSSVESKQFYQQQRLAALEAQSMSPSPVTGRSPTRQKPRTYSSHVGGDASVFTGNGRLRSRLSNTSFKESLHQESAYKSALPVGLSDPDKHPDNPEVQTPGIGRFEAQNGFTANGDSAGPDKRTVLFERNRPDFDKNPEKFAPKVWNVGAVMLIGEVVE